MVADRKARLQGDEWARIWTYESARVQRESVPPFWLCAVCVAHRPSNVSLSPTTIYCHTGCNNLYTDCGISVRFVSLLYILVQVSELQSNVSC
jgi:hypothetical protein